MSSRGAGSWVAVGVTVGSCGEGGVMPVGAAVVASAFLFFLRSRLFLLLPFFSPSPPSSFGTSSFPTSSSCCLTDSASGASRGKVLALIVFDRSIDSGAKWYVWIMKEGKGRTGSKRRKEEEKKKLAMMRAMMWESCQRKGKKLKSDCDLIVVER